MKCISGIGSCQHFTVHGIYLTLTVTHHLQKHQCQFFIILIQCNVTAAVFILIPVTVIPHISRKTLFVLILTWNLILYFHRFFLTDDLVSGWIILIDYRQTFLCSGDLFSGRFYIFHSIRQGDWICRTGNSLSILWYRCRFPFCFFFIQGHFIQIFVLRQRSFNLLLCRGILF